MSNASDSRSSIHVRCPECREFLWVAPDYCCAESFCHWCPRSYLYVIVDDGQVHLLDLASESWRSEAQHLAAELRLKFVDVEQESLNVSSIIPWHCARQCDVIAVNGRTPQVSVASACPTDLDLFEWLRFLVSRMITPVLGSRDAIHRVICLHAIDDLDIHHDVLEDDESYRPWVQRAFRDAKHKTDEYWLSKQGPFARDYTGYLTHLWKRQKRTLEEEFGLDWSSPIELNPRLRLE